MTRAATRIWEFSPWLPYAIDAGRFAAACRFLNGEEVLNAGQSPGQWRAQAYVTPKLHIDEPGFDIDCFVLDGVFLVSEKFRQAAQLGPDEVQYFEVSDVTSASKAKDKKFEVMSVPVRQKVSSADNSPRSGLLGLLYRPGEILSEAEVEYPLFYDEVFRGSLFCADELALRVLKAECSGVRFLHPDFAELTSAMRFRTLRGVEEEGDWDSDRKIELTTLVEGLDL